MGTITLNGTNHHQGAGNLLLVEATLPTLLEHLCQGRRLFGRVGGEGRPYWAKRPGHEQDELLATPEEVLRAWVQGGESVGSGMQRFEVQRTRAVRLALPTQPLPLPASAQAVAWSPDGKWLATSLSTGEVLLRTWPDSTVSPSSVKHAQATLALGWAPNSQTLATASQDHTVRLWSVPQGLPVLCFEGHPAPVTTLAWSPDGKRLASGDLDSVQVWTPQPGTPLLWHLKAHRAPVRALAWSPDGRWLASGGDDRLLLVADARSGQQIWGVYSSTLLTAVAWSSDGSLLATGGEDGALQLWTPQGGGPFTVQGHQGPVHSLAWSPGGTALASASQDGTVRVWTARNWRHPLCEWTHEQGARAVAWASTGWLASLGGDRALLLVAGHHLERCEGGRRER